MARNWSADPDKNVHKAKDYAQISRAMYKRETIQYTFSMHISTLQDGYTTLEECEEPVAEGKKVTDLLANTLALEMAASSCDGGRVHVGKL
jgi:hypothetical protein